jgi:hypothetical protein
MSPPDVSAPKLITAPPRIPDDAGFLARSEHRARTPPF